MTLFQRYTFKWWQFVIFKLCLIAIGVLIGSTWSAIFHGAGIIVLLLLFIVVSGVYLATAAYKQLGK